MHDKANEPLPDCSLCPRLTYFRQENQQKFPGGFHGAVPSFGNLENSSLVIVGLAPGLHGANMTGRPFTGDYAGDLLYATLLKFGFAEGVYEKHAGDGLRLKNAFITNAVRCVPPENKPTPPEIQTCAPFLKRTLLNAPELKILIVLGKIAHDATVRSFGKKLKDFPFTHGAVYNIHGNIRLISSYHCSRYNTNTGRLTVKMFEDIFNTAKDILSSYS